MNTFDKRLLNIKGLVLIIIILIIGLIPGYLIYKHNTRQVLQSANAQDVLTNQISLNEKNKSNGSIDKSNSGQTPNYQVLVMPLPGQVVRGIGNYFNEAFQAYLFHAGTDYAAAEGTVVRVAKGGKVIEAGHDPLFGEKVILDCGESWIVVYGGLDNLRVKTGDVISDQTAIGQITLDPGADEPDGLPHLHYEVWHGNKLQKPKIN